MAAGAAPIRLAALPDLARVCACVDAAFQPYVLRIGQPPAPMRADHAGLIARGRVHLIEARGRLAGVLVTERAADQLRVEIMAIDPEAQRAGLGRRLMAFAENDARRTGLGRVRLYTHALMSEARAFYRALGYAEVETRHEAGYERVYLEKPVQIAH